VNFYSPRQSSRVGYNPLKQGSKKNNMRTIVIVMLACVASPALADVYRCNSGSKTIYQDVPCSNGKVIDNINGQPPSRAEQIKAVERANRDRSFTAQLRQERETKDRGVTVTQTKYRSSPAALKPSGPDRYYDRPDRFKHRAVSGTTYIQHK
jgi:hypothetical protein